MPSVPSRINVLGAAYTVQFKKLKAMFGRCTFLRKKIDISPDLCLRAEQQTTIHELLHAIRHEQGREYMNEVEEDFVNSLANGLLEVLQQNPRLVAYLLHHEQQQHQ